MTEHGSQERDPGSRLSRVIALIAAIVLFGFVAISQNLGGGGAEASEDEQTERVAETVAPNLQADMTFRSAIKMSGLFAADPNSMDVLEPYALSMTERVYLAVVAGELDGAEAAIERLEALADAGSEDEDLLSDIRLFRLAYEDVGQIGEQAEARLIDRHGFYARVALTHGLEAGDAERQAARGGGVAFGILIVMGLGFFAAFGLGCVLFIVAAVLVGLKKIRVNMPRPIPGGSVFLEVFALFVGGFLVLHLLVEVLVSGLGLSGSSAVGLSLGAQWLLLLVPLWPLVRGMKFEAWRKAIGLSAPRGVLREVGVGLVAYLAALPLFAAGVVAVVVMMSIQAWLSADQQAPPSNPIVELLAGTSGWVLWLLVATAVVWAPLCEELVFRGALLRHMSGRVPVLVAGLLTALLFAFMHNYGPMMAPPLIALGFAFALMRLWRVSLVSAITAHAIHNGILVVFMLVLIKAMGE